MSRASEESAGSELATLLKGFRVRAGFSQQSLADQASVSVQAVSALERGYRKVPYPKTLERLCDALSLSDEDRSALEDSARRARGLRSHEHDSASAHNLPRQLTSFLGRDDEVSAIAALVKTAPLVSVVGTGGIGKTRVAIEVANQLLADFPDGVWFVELAPLNDPDLVVHAIAAALGVQESPRMPLLATLASNLSRNRSLVILDNCEHVIDQARSAVGSLIRECPKVAFLATSREALMVTGERAYRLPSLAVPDQDDVSPAIAMTYGAVALFVDRVTATDARFAVDEKNVPPIAEICRRLDGLPLAIELAAARSTVLSFKQIAERLDHLFDVLIPSDPTALPRHQTLRSVIEWSYDLLSSKAKLLFARLGIFRSSFSLETAISVCAGGVVANDDVLDLLSSLISQSMVMAEFSRGEARYHMLEATRQFGLEKLTELGEREIVAERQARSSLQTAERLDRGWYEADERRWFNDAAADLDNCRAALEWSLGEKRDVPMGSYIAGTLERVWYSFAPVEGRNWVRLALSSLGENVQPALERLLLIADSELCGSLGEYVASYASAQRAIRISEPFDEMQLARAKQSAGTALGALGRAQEAESLLREALAVAERLSSRRLQALALGDLGTVRSRRGDIDGARHFYDEALTYYTALNLERPAASIAGNLAEIEFASGDVAAALHRAEEARGAHEAWHNRRSVANDLCNIAAYLIAMDCFDDARVHAISALKVAREVKATVLTAYILQHFAAIGTLDQRGETVQQKLSCERSAMLLGFVNARLAALQSGREYTEQQECDRIVAVLRDQLSSERFETLMLLGEEWSDDGACVVALDL
jgi:predicted ATPase/DNA-binding XRE family transcriptional regulator